MVAGDCRDPSDCRDPKDDKFLELALNGKATHIVSGDEDLLVLHPFRGIPILTPHHNSFLVALNLPAETAVPLRHRATAQHKQPVANRNTAKHLPSQRWRRTALVHRMIGDRSQGKRESEWVE